MILDENLAVSTPAPPREFELAGEKFKYPLLVKRYKALLIDSFLLFTIMVTIMVLMGDHSLRAPVMITTWILFAFVYEPFLTVHSATVGHRLMGIRVRDFKEPAKPIGLWQAYIRLLVKYFLGWASFLTIHFNAEHRALHDMAGSSVMIEVP